jgi:hypothetical protein
VRLAWFAPTPDDVALELGRRHQVDLYDERRAHDFVWRHGRAAYDLTLFELADSPAHAYVWPYVFHYPGVVVLRATSLQRTRGLALQQRRHHLRAERAFAGPDLLRTPLVAARMVIVHDDAAARELRNAYPDVDVRMLPVGVAPPTLALPEGAPRFHCVSSHPALVERAAGRARDTGTPIETTYDLNDLRADDVVVALEWPPTGSAPIDALRTMAAGLSTIVFETEAVAAWPTLDPQTWKPRGYLTAKPPIAISIDPRDEVHSLMLAMRRLAQDVGLRARLGKAAQAWAREQATVAIAAPAWEAALVEAMRTPPPATQGLPPHLFEDGTAAARSILREFDVSVDVLES